LPWLGKSGRNLIILDIGLTAGDGFVGLDRLQQSAQLSSIPVIVLTARDPQYNRERTLKAGAVAKACRQQRTAG
jgi:DNA-binding response OmpR family regulator